MSVPWILLFTCTRGRTRTESSDRSSNHDGRDDERLRCRCILTHIEGPQIPQQTGQIPARAVASTLVAILAHPFLVDSSLLPEGVLMAASANAVRWLR